MPAEALKDEEPTQQTSADAASAALIAEARAMDPSIAAVRTGGTGGFERWDVPYMVDGVEFEGFAVRVASDGSPEEGEQRPGVLILHTAVGRHDDFMVFCAEKVAAMGYVAFVGDLYGREESMQGWQQAQVLMARSRADRERVQGSRVEASLRVLQGLESVDPSAVAAIGFCFGGQVVTDLAKRCGKSDGLQAWASVHGTVGRSADEIALRLCEGDVAPGLVLHGADDTFVTDLPNFLEEFSAITDVNLISFARTTHGFCRPDKTPGDDKMRYSPEAAKESWRSIESMLERAFGARCVINDE